MRGLNVMRIAGIRVMIDPSWLIIFFLLVWSLATGYFPQAHPPIEGRAAWILGVAAALLLFGSVLIHELSHALVAQRAGVSVPRIRLFLFGGVSEMASEPPDPRSEVRIAAAGPLTSFALAVFFFVIVMSGLPSIVPGGRQLVELIKGGNLGGLWLMVIGIFLNQAASASYESLLLRDTLSGCRVRQIMTQPVIAVPEHASLDELARDYFFRHPRGSFPVSSGELFAGMVSLDQLKSVPRDEWLRTPVRQIMTPAERLRPLGPEDDCTTALEAMVREEVG